MNKYQSLWEHVQENCKQTLKLIYDEIHLILFMFYKISRFKRVPWFIDKRRNGEFI